MDIVLLLSRNESERKLRKVAWAVAGMCVAWGIGSGAAFSSGQATLTAAHASLQARQTAYETQQITDRAMERVVHHLPAAVQSTAQYGTSDMAYQLAAMAQSCGARMTTIQFADPTLAASDGNGETNTSNAVQGTFSGSFESLLQFLDGLSDSQLNLEISSINLNRQQIDPQTGVAAVDMRLSGNLEP